MADFDIAHSRTSKTEAGYQNNPDDGGNWTTGAARIGVLIGTNRGISAPVLALWLKREPTVGDMKQLSANTSEMIYRANYWTPIRGDEIIDQNTANNIYDMGVNAGVRRAIILEQQNLGIAQTGKMDQQTLDKINLI